jgi:hypothetical protein
MDATIRIAGHPDTLGRLVIERGSHPAWRVEVPLSIQPGERLLVKADVGKDTYVGQAFAKTLTPDGHGTVMAHLDGDGQLFGLDLSHT